MKINLNTNQVLNLIIIGYILYIVIISSLGISNAFWVADINNRFNYDNKLKPIDARIPDSLSFYRYNEMEDSVKIIRRFKNGEGMATGLESHMGFIETINASFCDTCSLKYLKDNAYENIGTTQRYIKLLGWKVRSSNSERLYTDSVQFHVEHGQSYIRKLAQVSTTINSDSLKSFYKYYTIDVPVKFRYDRVKECMMIPIGKSTKLVLDIVLDLITLFLFLFIARLFFDFLRFLIDLSKGHSFTEDNVKRLKLIAISFLAFPTLIFLFTLLLRLIFNSYFTSDVVLNFDTINWKILAVGVIFLLLFKAFRQGKILKEEQELTV